MWGVGLALSCFTVPKESPGTQKSPSEGGPSPAQDKTPKSAGPGPRPARSWAVPQLRTCGFTEASLQAEQHIISLHVDRALSPRLSRGSPRRPGCLATPLGAGRGTCMSQPQAELSTELLTWAARAATPQGGSSLCSPNSTKEELGWVWDASTTPGNCRDPWPSPVHSGGPRRTPRVEENVGAS